MTVSTKSAKSFAPQDLKQTLEIPAADWGVEKLTEYALCRHRSIDAGEKRLAPEYWLLGAALVLLRKDFGRGQWERFLRSKEITPTRAAKARAIRETFSTIDDVRDKSVEEAYAQRERPQAHPLRKAKRKVKLKNVTPSITTPSLFKDCLKDVVMRSEAFKTDELQRFPGEKQELLDAVAAAIRNLEALRNRLSAEEPKEP